MSDTRREKEELSLLRKFGFGLGAGGGANFISCMTASFLTLYYTDVALVSAAFVGTMMFVVRLLDCMSDIIIGHFIDRTNTKMGRARPWLLGSTFPLAILLVLTFSVPENMTVFGKSVYIYVTYILLMVVAFTIEAISVVVLRSLMTNDHICRQQISTIQFFMSQMAIMCINMFTNTLVTKFGGGQQGWRAVAILYAVIVIVTHMITFFSCKETVLQTAAEKETVPKNFTKNSFGEGCRALFSTKYTFILLILYIATFITTTASNGVGIFFCRDVLGNAGLFAMITVTCSIPTLICMLFTTKIVQKMGKKRTLYLGQALQIFGYGCMFFANTNLPAIYIGSVVRGIGMALYSPVILAVVSDLSDYIEYKTGKDVRGLAGGVSTFGQKVGMGLGSALLGWLLGLGGYNAVASVQSDQALFMMRVIFALIPVICFMISLICTIGFNVEQDNKDMMTEKG